MSTGLLERWGVVGERWPGRGFGPGVGSVSGAAGVAGMTGDTVGVLDFFKVPTSGGPVGPQVVGGHAIGEGLIFGEVVEHGGLQVKA